MTTDLALRVIGAANILRVLPTKNPHVLIVLIDSANALNKGGQTEDIGRIRTVKTILWALMAGLKTGSIESIKLADAIEGVCQLLNPLN